MSVKCLMKGVNKDLAQRVVPAVWRAVNTLTKITLATVIYECLLHRARRSHHGGASLSPPFAVTSRGTSHKPTSADFPLSTCLQGGGDSGDGGGDGGGSSSRSGGGGTTAWRGGEARGDGGEERVALSCGLIARISRRRRHRHPFRSPAESSCLPQAAPCF